MEWLARFVLLLAAFIGSAILTWQLRRYALRQGMLDVPNARSSHQQPIPRGGGLALVVVVEVGITLLHLQQQLPLNHWLAVSGGVAVALIGWIDDRSHVAARWRLLVQFLATGWLLWWLIETLPMGGIGGLLLLAIGVMWCSNLYNFMDGIDGIAAVQLMSVCVGSALLPLLATAVSADGLDVDAMVNATFSSYQIVALLLAAASGGFLLFNWPPARIFMGDVGSSYSGFIVAALPLLAAGALPLPAWLILNSLFFVDATVTLLVRIGRGERWYEAHRSHAYQRAAERLGAHRPVTVAVLLINLFWCWPLAWATLYWPEMALLLMGVTGVPLVGAMLIVSLPLSDTATR